MDIPSPPNDIELRNIIDKLAEFVARNGPEFESMTKLKQKGNSKFAFLYGGEYYNYYQYKVTSKQAMMKQGGHPLPLMGQQINPFGQQSHNQQQQQQQNQNTNQMPQIWANPPPSQVAPQQQQQQQQAPPQPVISAQIAAQIEAISGQQIALREQIRQSELNLTAQHGVLLQQQQAQIDEAVTRAQNDTLVKQADDSKVSLSDFDAKLQPIIDSCTKDSISNGKGWILQHCTDSGKCQIISQYLLRKALIAGVIFAQKLHLIYLVNDVIHHCIRKRADDLKKCLENVVIPMFCNAQITAQSDEQRAKLSKLLSLWESKGNFFDACVISKLKAPTSSLQDYQNSLLTQYAAIVAQITQATKVTFDNYLQQHQVFVQHATQQLALLEKQKQQIEQQALKAALVAQQHKNAAPPPLLPELSGGSNNGLGQVNSMLNANRGNNDRDVSIPSLLEQNINFTLLSGALQNLQNINNQTQNNRDNDSRNSSLGADDRDRRGNYAQSNNSGDGNNNNGDYTQPPPNFPGPQPLLGKQTAKQLGVLIVGLPSQHELVQNVSSIRPFPSIHGVKIHIPIDKSVQPVVQRFRRLPFATLERVEDKLKELLAKDIIEKVSEPSRWVSPLVVVIKDSGEIRLCIDMRQVNKAVLRETHPLPTIEDVRWMLNGAVYFSRLDIKDAFHQLELDDESKPLTTFITHKGLYRYKRLVFGISCAPEIFQKIIEQILSDCGLSINFIDDIIVVGRTEQEHDEALRKVLNKFRDYGVLLNHAKCAFKLTEIDFLGHRFNKDGMTPSPSKIEALQSFRAPTTCEEVRSFLGLVNYVGAFIPNLATTSFPLRELTKNKAVFQWTLEEQKAFDELLKAICHVDRLSHFDPKLKTRVVADASPVGLGAVLLQFFEGMSRVVSYASKSLTETERRYAQTEKEALVLVWAVERFQIYLVGIRFELETDHKPLEAIFSPDSSPCLRVERWVLRLQAFSYDVVYRKGKSNIADSLSRLAQTSKEEPFDPECDIYIRNVLELEAVDIGELEKASCEDPELRELRSYEYLDRGVWNYTSSTIKPYHAFRNEFGKVGELMVRGSRLIVPAKMRQRMLQLAHEGHPGRTKMQQRLRLAYWWPGMDDAIARVVDGCEGCRLVSQPDRPEPMERRRLPDAPWIDIAIDFLGPLPSGDYLLVIIDYYSRYKEVEILQKITAKETSDRLEKIFVRLGFPRTITLDNGRQFVSIDFERYCRNRGIILNKTTPYWPQENGLVERQNRSLMKRLKISQALNHDWKRDLLTYLLMYYSTPHSTTGKTPAELMFGRNIRTKLPTLGDLCTESPPTEHGDRDLHEKEKGKDAENLRRRAKPSNLGVGDEVYMKNVLPGNKLTPTFNPTVMTVTAKHGSRVTVQNSETGKSYDRNSSHLKRVATGNGDHEDETPTEAQWPCEPNSTIGPGLGPNLDEPSPGLMCQPSKEAIDQNDRMDRSRSQREIRKPKRFNDCIFDY